MPLSDSDRAKLDQLRADPFKSWEVAELVAVFWPAPDGPIYYCSTQLDELPGYESLGARGLAIELRFNGNQFLDIPIDSGVSDDKIDLDFWDGDGAISGLFQAHGEGVRVEVFYYFPEVDLLLSQWWGHLRPPTDADGERFKASANFGFLSAMMPLPRRGKYSSCSALYGGLLKTLAEVAENDCPYNVHLDGGATGNPGFPTCPRNRPACIARLGDDKSYLGFDTVIQSYTVNQTKGPNINVTTRGNESNLKRPVRVIIGERHVSALDLLAYTIEPDTKHPEGGAVTVLMEVAEGPINGQSGQTVQGIRVGYQHLNVRNGELRQARTGFSTSVSNYSGTALFFARVQGDFTKISAADLHGEVDVQGLRDIRVYSDPVTFVAQYSQSRPWGLFRALTDKRWGHGHAEERYWIPDFIELDAWCVEIVTVHDKDGNVTTGPRSTFNAEFIDRTAQQQITDICRTGRFSLPYPEFGTTRIRPLRKATADELTSATVFTDIGEDRNIVVNQNGNSLLSWSAQSDADLVNRVLVTYDDAAHLNAEVPLIFEDADQQLASGRAFGDFTRRAVEQTYAAFGTTNVGEAARWGNTLLDLGEFDEGGLKNNLRWTFTTWWTFAVALTKYQIVKLVSPKLDRLNAIRAAQGLEEFHYFRVRSFRRMPDLKVELSVQAYPVAYYEQLESDEAPAIPPVPPDPNPGGGGGRLPFKVGLLSLGHTDDRINFELDQPTIP